MRAFGVLIWVVAAFFFFGALGMDTSVPTSFGSRVHNIGLMRYQEMGIMIGIGLLIVGALFIALGGKKTPARIDLPLNTTDSKTCPFCAETIKKEAIVCRYCGKDLPPIVEESEFDKASHKDLAKTPTTVEDAKGALRSMGHNIERGSVGEWRLTYKSGNTVNLRSDEALVKVAKDLVDALRK